MTSASLRFDERQIRLILKSLPEGVSSRKLELLPKILKEWSDNDLKRSRFRVDPRVAKGRAMRIKAIAKHAGELSRALDEFVDYAGAEFLDFPGDSWLVFELAKRISPMGFQDEVSSQRQRLQDQRNLLRELESVAADLAGSFRRSADQ